MLETVRLNFDSDTADKLGIDSDELTVDQYNRIKDVVERDGTMDLRESDDSISIRRLLVD